MVVTRIEEFDRKRKKIYIDDEYAFFLYNSELVKYGIAQGAELSAELYREIEDGVVSKRVKLRALNILKAAQKTEKQLYDKLAAGGYTREQASAGVEYAKSFGYVDDLYYARYYVENSCAERSRRDIEERLYRRGIPKDIIEQVLEACTPDEDGAIWNALRKKSVTEENIAALDYASRNKLFAFLIRKGFSPDKVRRILRYGDEFV